ncbi:MAG: acyltransferase family protein [Chloroflexota bacterium]|nr:acyltransferase family protein [Chloroflexota bacterium]
MTSRTDRTSLDLQEAGTDAVPPLAWRGTSGLQASSATMRIRFHEMDFLRAAAMLQGIFFHAALSFTALDSAWFVRDRSHHWAVDFLAWTSHTFRMPIFFVMAGFFAHLLYHRYGLAGFVRQRVQRIGIPFVAGVLLLIPLSQALGLFGRAKIDGKSSPSEIWGLLYQHFTSRTFLTNMNTGHLWFLYYLLLLYTAAITLTVAGRWLLHESGLDRLDRYFSWSAKSHLAPLVLSVPTVLLYLILRRRIISVPVSFTPDLLVFAYYGLFFSFGWLLHRQPALLQDYGRRTFHNLGAAALVLMISPWYLRKAFERDDPYYVWWALCTLSMTALFTWLMVFGLIGFSVRYFSRPSARVRYVSDSAYWLYLMHLPLVVFLQILLADSPLPGILKYLLIVLISMTLLLLSYHYFVRYTFIGATLNGKRERRG